MYKVFLPLMKGFQDKYPDGRRLDIDDFNFMLDLLSYHENSEIKIGCGVDYMYVGPGYVNAMLDIHPEAVKFYR